MKKNGKKILVIEDEEIIAAVLKDSLNAMGHEVVVAYSGVEGLRKANQIQPDIITLDIMMCGLGGLQILKQLKANKETKDIPIIIISIAADSMRGEVLKLGAIAFLKKPINFNELNEKIKRISNKKTVLVVDDDPDFLRLLKTRLNSMGYTVITLSDEKLVLNKTKELKPDIILIDMLLPNEDGFAVTKKLKDDEETAEIPVIAFSGYFGDEIGKKEIVGVDRFINEEFSAEDLAEEINKMLTDISE